MVWKQGASVAVWGSGLNAEKVYVKYAGKYDIRIVVDNFKNKEFIFNKKIVSAEEFFSNDEYRDLKIIIASDKWKEIAVQLRNKGLRAGEDFLPYIMLDAQDIEVKQILELCRDDEIESCIDNMRQEREIAIFWGNCQVNGVREFCKHNAEFSKKYFVIKFPNLWRTDELLEYCDKPEIWRKCDLFICQKVSSNNKFDKKVSEEYRKKFIKQLNEKCIFVSIPNLRFEGYYPQIAKNGRVALTNVQWEGISCLDKNIISMVDNGEKDEKIIELIESETFYKEHEVKEHFNKCLSDFQNYEAECDIHIGDYLEQNRVLYYSPFHPHAEVVYELAKRLLEYLDISDCHIKEKDIIVEHLKRVHYFHKCEYVYPSVLKGLGIGEYDEQYRLNIFCYTDETISGREVLERYIAICKGYKK